MVLEEELFAAVDALLEERSVALPEPAERARLRRAAGVTQSVLARTLSASIQTVKNWESGRAEPRAPRLEPYKWLLHAWANKFPAPVPGLSATEPPSSGPWADIASSRNPAAGPGGRGAGRAASGH